MFLTIVHFFIITTTEFLKWVLTNVHLYLPSLTTTISVGLLVIGWYYLFWTPFDRFRDLTELGFEEVNRSKRAEYKTESAKRQAINRLMQLRKIGDLPPAYPNGWYVILESDELGKSETKEVNALGLNLVVWRGETGKSFVADAHCPHLGAHLGVGGKVVGDCIKCPFHGWTFEGCNGSLTNIPYSDSVLQSAKIKIWNTLEANGFIYLWYHAEGEEPSWYPEIFPEIQSGTWKYRGRSELRVSCHIQEIPENGADMSHLNIVHDMALMCGGEPEYSWFQWEFIKHVWDGRWKVSEKEDEKHVAIMELKHEMCLVGKIPLVVTNLVIRQVGPATVCLLFQTSLGRGILFHNVTPLEPMLQRVTHRFYSSSTLIHPYGKLILLGEAIMIERDMRIWNRKTFIKNPLLTKEDRMIKQFRNWYSQFYSQNSPKCFFAKNDNGLEF